MPNILDEIRRLEEAQRRGEVDAAEVAKLRREILSMVEEAEEVAPSEPPEDRPRPQSKLIWDGALVGTALVLLTLLVTWLSGDLGIALTLSVTLLAGIIIHAARDVIHGPAPEAETATLDEYDEQDRPLPAE